ncbi:hypothetical protein BofuT4_P001250.1 [Botrytis cinerea T4]|uniref:Uncharacterized protein n=1 Tax=Botryotinia fuckeliana (strain T4) TaxID=999810 RepID=G2YM30_BOTF4|nr:hypothetical protein BofuT4_P001250.1 [Botrytis cinerea T4]
MQCGPTIEPLDFKKINRKVSLRSHNSSALPLNDGSLFRCHGISNATLPNSHGNVTVKSSTGNDLCYTTAAWNVFSFAESELPPSVQRPEIIQHEKGMNYIIQTNSSQAKAQHDYWPRREESRGRIRGSSSPSSHTSQSSKFHNVDINGPCLSSRSTNILREIYPHP